MHTGVVLTLLTLILTALWIWGACMRAQWSTHGIAHGWRGILSESHCGERDTRCAQLLCGLHEACPVDGVVRIALGLLDDQFRPEFPLTFPEPVLRMPRDAHVRRATVRLASRHTECVALHLSLE